MSQNIASQFSEATEFAVLIQGEKSGDQYTATIDWAIGVELSSWPTDKKAKARAVIAMARTKLDEIESYLVD